ncbi:MAG: TonB-dependent receptor [Alphaproteobacteria bacterium]|nr:TonB-dependent receptor [Alphaproteobacteria bacterium]
MGEFRGPGKTYAVPSRPNRRDIHAVILAGVSFATLGLAALMAPAAAAEPAASTGIEVVIVTAEKRAENINRVPMSITAATADQLIDRGITQPRDLNKLVPGFSYADSYAGTPIYTLRGVGFSDISLGGRPTVSIYTDQAPIPFAIETRGVDLDLARVEVLKGPQGTLFGQNSTGGAINFIAAKPTDTFQAGIDASYGNFNSVAIGGFISGPLSDSLEGRIAVKHTQRDGWQKSYTHGGTTGAGDFTNGRVILDWTPDTNFKAELNVNGYIDRSDTQAAQLIAITPAIPAAAPFVPGLLNYPLAPANARAADWDPGRNYARNNNFVQANLRLDYTLGNRMTITSLTSASHFNLDQLDDYDGMALSNLSQRTIGKIDSFYEELRLAGHIQHRGHFVAGATYAYDKVLETNYDAVPQSTQAFIFTGFGLPLFKTFRDIDNQRTNTTAVFASADYNLTQTINIYGGARYTSSNDRFNGCSGDTGDGNAASVFGPFWNIFRGMLGLAPNPAIAPGGCVTANAAFVPGMIYSRLNEDNVSRRAGLSWRPVDSTMLYANVSKGYKAGGFPDLGATSASQYLPAKQESLLAYEAGFKSTLADNTLQLNGAVFYYDYSDKQILGRYLDPILGPLLRLINVPKSQVRGAELEAQWAPIEGLNISAGASYIESEILDRFTNYNPNGVLTDFGGEAFPNTPRWQFVSDASYTFPVSDNLSGFVGGGLTYQSATNSQLGNLALLTVRAYSLVDLRAGFETEDGRWRVTLWGRNVGDTYYWTAANRDLDTTVRYAGMPATYGVTLSFRYN